MQKFAEVSGSASKNSGVSGLAFIGLAKVKINCGPAVSGPSRKVSGLAVSGLEN